MSEMIRTICGSCSIELALPASSVGKSARCPSCQSVFPVMGSQAARPYSNAPQPNPYASTKAPAPVPLASRFDDHNPPPLGLMTIPLYISAVIYGLIGLAMVPIILLILNSDTDPPEARFFFSVGLGFAGAMSLALAGFVVFFTGKLKQRKKWAWICAIGAGALYATSAFILMGIPILIGALNKDVQAWFNNK